MFQIKNLAKLSQTLNSTETVLSQAANPLLNRFALLQDLLATNKLSNQQKRHLLQQLEYCVSLMTALIEGKSKPKNLRYLKKMLYTNAFEIRANSSFFKHYSLTTLDMIINGFNNLRGFIFRSAYPRAHFAKKDIITGELERFIRVAQGSSTGLLLSALRPKEPAEPQKLTEEEKNSSHLNQVISDIYNALLLKKIPRQKKQQLTQLIIALNSFAEQTLKTQQNAVTYPAAEQAFLASQDLAIEILQQRSLSLKKMRRLTICLKQTTLVLANPGQKSEVEKLEKLVRQSDYSRCQSDKEKSSYAILHIIASIALLSLAIFEAMTIPCLSLMVNSFTIAAELSSLIVGGGQALYFSKSRIHQTFYADSMDILAQAARLNSKHSDWTNIELEGNRKKLLNQAATSLITGTPALEEEVQKLMSVLEQLREINLSTNSIIKNQATTVLQHGEDLALDLLTAQNPSLKRIRKLSECILAAAAVAKDPSNAQSNQHLILLLSQRNYETRKLIKRDALIGGLLILASLALFAITITGTALSGGITAGTILSPIMLTIMALNKLAHCNPYERTPLGEDLRKLSDFGQVLSLPFRVMAKKPTVQENPIPNTELPAASAAL